MRLLVREWRIFQIDVPVEERDAPPSHVMVGKIVTSSLVPECTVVGRIVFVVEE